MSYFIQTQGNRNLKIKKMIDYSAGLFDYEYKKTIFYEAEIDGMEFLISNQMTLQIMTEIKDDLTMEVTVS